MSGLFSRIRPVLLAFTALAASSALAIYAVPLYRLFCQVTGYGGTTQRVAAAGEEVLDRAITVRFDASVDHSIPWNFRPVKHTKTVRVGETALSYYQATNRSDRPITGTAVFNVTPHKAGLYFAKIECFCFTEQTLAPGETAMMPVTWFIDPAIAGDHNLDDLTEITLSYTFFLKDGGEKAGAHAALAN